MDMIKNQTIEKAFSRYFDGAPAPQVDLSAAKNELRASARRRERARRRLRWQVPAIAAALLIMIILGYNFLPSLFVKHYSIAQTSAETVSYTELRENYGGYLDGLNRFALADNASTEYTIYSVNGKAVLLGADVRYLSGFTLLRATVLVDLSDGKYAADELADYEALERKYGGYRYEKRYVDGEFVYRAYSEYNDTRYYVDFTSQDDNAFYVFMNKLLP